MITASLIRSILPNSAGADQRLYKLSEPARYGHDDEAATTFYVIVSGANVPFSGPETYIYPASKVGHIIDWMELPGSFRGSIDHNKALNNAGYTIVDGGAK